MPSDHDYFAGKVTAVVGREKNEISGGNLTAPHNETVNHDSVVLILTVDSWVLGNNEIPSRPAEGPFDQVKQ